VSDNHPENYVLSQRGHARVDFLIEFSTHNRMLEIQADNYASDSGLKSSGGPTDLDTLHQTIAPVMQQTFAFRLFRLVREWQLANHGAVVIEAFDEIRANQRRDLRRSGALRLTRRVSMRSGIRISTMV
jgi:hypothetical protein